MEEKKMKRIYGIFAAVLCLAAGCAKEIAPSNDAQVTVLTAGVAQTKTILDGSKVYWTAGDQINVNGVTSNVLDIDAPSATAKFTFDGILNTPYKAVFPASVYKDENIVTMPSVQEYCETSFHSQASPMLAYSKDNGNLVFSHPFAVVCLYIKLKDDADKISYVEFRGNDNEQVCGDFTVDFTKLTLTETGSGGKVIRVNVDHALSADAPMLVHIVVPARTYANGFTIKVADENGHYMQKSVQTERVYEAGKVYDMKAIDFEPTETELDADLTIASAAELIAFANAWNEGEYTSTTEDPFVVNLTKDIEFTAEDNAEWPGIGVDTDACRFNGVFDGCSNTISGFTSTKPLFQYVDTEGIVQNLTLAGDVTYDLTDISEETNVSPFIYRSWGIINDCSSSVNVTVTSSEEITKEVRISGLLAYMTSGECNGCSYDGTLVWESSSSSARAYVGGVIAYVNTEEAVVEKCFLSGAIKLNASVTGDRSWFGGVVGYPLVPVSNCYTTEDAEVNVSNATKLRLGGVVGYAASTVTGCVNNAAITVNCPSAVDDTHTYVGGVVGRNAGKVSTSDNTGSITMTAGSLTQRIGGIVGQNYGSEIEDCENSGDIICNDVVVKKVRYYGGIVGYSTGKIYSCTNTATVSSATLSANIGSDNYTSNVLGGIAGYFAGTSVVDCDNKGTISNNYYCNSTSSDTAPHTGGIVGHAKGTSSARISVSSCEVITSNNSKLSSKRGWIGGVIGYAEYTDISGCTNKMSISDAGYYQGGISGQLNNSTMTSCVAEAEITSTQMKYSGGLVGSCSNAVNMSSSSFSGSISSTKDGSIKGLFSGNAAKNSIITIKDCSFSGSIDDVVMTDSDLETRSVAKVGTDASVTLEGNSIN